MNSPVSVHLAGVAEMIGMSVDALLRVTAHAERLAPFVAILGSSAVDVVSAAVGDVGESAVVAVVAAAAFGSGVAERTAFEVE